MDGSTNLPFFLSLSLSLSLFLSLSLSLALFLSVFPVRTIAAKMDRVPLRLQRNVSPEIHFARVVLQHSVYLRIRARARARPAGRPVNYRE